MLSKLLRTVYASVALKGLLTALAPRRVLRLIFGTWSVGLKNTGELEPRDWYVTAVRATGVGMLAAGGVGLLLSSRGEDDGGDGESHADDGDDESGSDRSDDEGVEPIDISPDE